MLIITRTDAQTIHYKDELHPPIDRDFLDVEFEFIQCDIAHPKLRKNLQKWSENELLTIAVCTNNAPKNMAFALYLPQEILHNANVWIYQKSDDSMNHFLTHENYKNVKTFSLKEIGIATMFRTHEYTLAKKVSETHHNHYGKESTNPKPWSWNDKKQSDRWSSLYNALSIVIKLRLAGIGLRMSENGLSLETFNLFDGNIISPIKFTKEQENMYSVVEHNRWNVEKLVAGFSPATKEQHEAVIAGKIKSKELKDLFIHDDIRPFEELNAVEKEKDYILTRSLIEAINNYGMPL